MDQPIERRRNSIPVADVWLGIGTVAVLCLGLVVSAACLGTAIVNPSAGLSPDPLAGPGAGTDFETLDPFDGNEGGWYTGPYQDGASAIKFQIEDGAYKWEIGTTRWGFIHTIGSNSNAQVLADFDLSVRARLVDGLPGDLCYGLAFRGSFPPLETRYYFLSVCESGSYRFMYFDGGTASWDILIDWTPTAAVRSGQWNEVAVRARGDHFTLAINGHQLAGIVDTHAASGIARLGIDIQAGASGVVWFDDFSVSSSRP